mgnify:FL=1
MVQPICSVWAESAIQKQSATKEITMTTQDAMKLAGDLVERGDLENANKILTKMPQTHNLALEIERWFLLA